MNTTEPLSALTHDSLFDGELDCVQPAQGYRFSLDAVLAAQFVHPLPGQQVLDLGCGCGIIGLILAYRVPNISVFALELQPQLADCCQTNIMTNGFADRMELIEGDVTRFRTTLQPEFVDLVVCNPPYGSPHGGRINKHHQAATARHELSGSLDDFIKAAAYAVRNRGKVVFIYPARRGASLLHSLMQHRLTPKRLQPIYSYPEAETARLIMVEAVKNGGEQFELLAPMYIYTHKNGPYAESMSRLYKRNIECLPK
nr:methyltransferase [uncultured Desulfobulbus sp.]